MPIVISHYRFLIAVLGWATGWVSLTSCSVPATFVPPTPTMVAALPTMTFTFHDDSCAYEGPTQIPLGKITVNLKDDGRSYSYYAVFITTLDAGKTIDDLNRAPADPGPSWVQKMSLLGPLEAGSSFTYITDLTQGLTVVEGGPIYLMCFTREPLTKIGVVGPIEVRK